MNTMKNTLLFKRTKLGLLLAFVLFTSFGWGQIIISQVYEGASNNKWIEITNIGSSAVNLATPIQYKIGIWTVSGSAGNCLISGNPTNNLSLTGTLNPGASYLLKNSSSSTTVPHSTMPTANSSNVTVCGFNGNDALAIFTGTNTIIDAFEGINNTDISYHRNSSVYKSNLTFTSTEWITKTLTEVANSTSIQSEYIGTHLFSSVWNGSVWSYSTPTASLDAIIDGTYTTTTNGVFTSKTLTVNATKSFTINTGHNITVAGAITNNGTFTVANNANLVQTNTTAVTNTGNIIVNKDSASIQLFDYTLWSSPVAGQKLKAFSPDTVDARFYSYNSATNVYNVVPAPLTTDFAIATGYLIRTPNTWTAATPTTFNGVFTGVPNNGDISISGLVSGNYYAVGNPYPSTISVADFYTANPNAGTLYFWRKTNGVVGTAYATRNSAGSTSASGGLTPSADIAVGQGFFVSPSAAMTLNFTNAMRATPSTSAVFLRTASEERNRFWLNLTNTTGLFSQMLVGYMPEATSGVDNAIDGRYINDAPTALTSLIDAEEYTIQGRALPFTTTDMVPLGFKTDAAGNYTIAIDHVDGLFSTGQTIYLKDNLLNTVVNLSAGSYSFASAIGVFNLRFEVLFQGALGVNNPTFTASSVVAFGENSEIKINSGSTIMEHVSVYDLQGRLLAEKKQVNATETKIQTSATNQVLLLEITAANGSKITKKIIQ